MSKKSQRDSQGYGNDFSDTPMFGGVRETSKEALDDLIGSGGLGRQEAEIVKFLKAQGGGFSLQEIVEALDIGVNAVSGRVNGLKKKGILKEFPKRKCLITGRTVIPVGV